MKHRLGIDTGGTFTDLAILDDLVSLGVCPLQLAGTDTELLFTAAEARAGKFTQWRRPAPAPAPGERS